MRDSVIFYRSFYEAVKLLPADLKAQVLTAIIEYALNGVVKGFLTLAKNYKL